MGFGGGGDSGSLGVSAHVHSNAVGEGGELKLVETLMSGMPLSTRILIGV